MVTEGPNFAGSDLCVSLILCLGKIFVVQQPLLVEAVHIGQYILKFILCGDIEDLPVLYIHIGPGTEGQRITISR